MKLVKNVGFAGTSRLPCSSAAVFLFKMLASAKFQQQKNPQNVLRR